MLYSHDHFTSITPTSIMTASRRYVDLLTPTPGAVVLDDLARGLESPRYRVQTTVPISIADHSLRTARLAIAFGEPFLVALACLLHDAAEGYLGDMPGPLKQHVRVELASGTVISWSELEALWTEAICDALLPESIAAKVAGLINTKRGPVAQYDHMALRGEALLWMPGAEDWAQGQAEPIYRAPLDPRVMPCMVAPSKSWSWFDTVAVSILRDDDRVFANMRRALGILL